jgi:peptide/nickel transport system substrate-binding protein
MAAHELSRRRFLALGALTVGGGTALLSACGGGDSSARVLERTRDGVLRIGVAAVPSNINPLDSGSEVTRWIAEPVMESLYTYDDQLRSVPLLAAGEPEVSDDGLVWSIPIRRDITWHNGDSVHAADVVATLAHMLDLSAGSEWITYMVGYVHRFDAPDDATVRIYLTRPYGLLRSHLTNLPISHRDYVKRRDTMMGTGPYRLDDYAAGQSFTMSRYDRYHGEAGSFAGIEYTLFTDATTRLVSLRQGKVDLITSVAAQNLSAAASTDGVELVLADAPLDVLTYVNMWREPFDDIAFRRAVAHSMDRGGVLRLVYGGKGTIGQGPIGPAELGWDADLDVYSPAPEYDRARSLLDRARTEVRSFTVTIGTSQTAKDIAQVLAAGWAQVGIEVTIEQLAGGPWSNKWLSREFEMLMNTFQSGFTSGPANYLVLAPASSTNILACGYQDQEVDRLVETIWETADDAEREAALRRLNRRLAEDAVIFPPVYPKLALAQRTELSPLDREQLRISRLAPQRLSFDT